MKRERIVKVGDIVRMQKRYSRRTRTGFVRGICASATDPNERTLDIAWFDNPDPPYWIAEYWLHNDGSFEVLSESR